MTRGTLLFWTLAALALVGFGTLVFFRLQPPNDYKDPAKVPKDVKTALVVTREVDRIYTTQGTIEARNRIDMNTEVPGTIAGIAFEEGDRVRRGQVLMRLRADKQQAQRLEAAAGMSSAENTVLLRQAEISRAEADLEAVKAAEELAQAEYQRYLNLYEGEFVSAMELDQKRSTYQQEVARRRAAEQELSRTRAQANQAKSQYTESQARYNFNRALASETLIQAPFTGVVGQKYVDLGDYVAPTEKLVTLVDNSRMQVMFPVPERYLGSLQHGLAVKVTVEGASQPNIPGQVNFISPAVNTENRTVTVKALLDQRLAAPLRDGQFGKVTLTLETVPGLVIPEQALVPQGEKFFVYLVREGKAFFHEVEIGERGTGWAEVTAGLKAGDRVVTNGHLKLFDGALIRETTPPARAGTQGN